MLKVTELASVIAKKEGHKSQARIGDIREIVGILADLAYDDVTVIHLITKLGIDRAKRRKKVV